jgi:hypothetical protein
MDDPYDVPEDGMLISFEGEDLGAGRYNRTADICPPTGLASLQRCPRCGSRYPPGLRGPEPRRRNCALSATHSMLPVKVRLATERDLDALTATLTAA